MRITTPNVYFSAKGDTAESDSRVAVAMDRRQRREGLSTAQYWPVGEFAITGAIRRPVCIVNFSADLWGSRANVPKTCRRLRSHEGKDFPRGFAWRRWLSSGAEAEHSTKVTGVRNAINAIRRLPLNPQNYYKLLGNKRPFILSSFSYSLLVLTAGLTFRRADSRARRARRCASVRMFYRAAVAKTG